MAAFPFRPSGWQAWIENMAFNPQTKRGYNLFEVASCLQKSIRRANITLAGYMAIELFESGYGAYCWKRLLIISAEDCAGIITQEIKALQDWWLVLSRKGQRDESRLFLSKAVILLCQARKCRDADHLQNFIYDREMIDAQQLDAALHEARTNPENIELPDYTFDVHTKKGRKRGKTKADFFHEEFHALKPREQGLFDWTIDPPPTE
jgi:replication-associated recombination protein RarA